MSVLEADIRHRTVAGISAKKYSDSVTRIHGCLRLKLAVYGRLTMIVLCIFKRRGEHVETRI